MIYFVSGHRDLTQEEFDEHYVPMINDIMNNDPFTEFVVGDWEGCDTMIIDYLLNRFDYPPITIYHVEEQPRVKFGNESVLKFKDIFSTKLPSYDDCDKQMTFDSKFDVAWIRPGREDSQTAMNIKRRFNLKTF